LQRLRNRRKKAEFIRLYQARQQDRREDEDEPGG